MTMPGRVKFPEYETLLIETIKTLSVASGVVTSPVTIGSNTLTDATKDWPADIHKNRLVKVLSGSGTGQFRVVSNNSNKTLVVKSGWVEALDTTSVYIIFEKDIAQILRDVLNAGYNISNVHPITLKARLEDAGGTDIDGINPLPIIANKTYREQMSQQNKEWIEAMYISKAEFSGANFGTNYQTLSKTYEPVIKTGVHTLTVVATHQNDFNGKTNTLLEIEIDGGGVTRVATFKWRKETFLGKVFGGWTAGVLTGVDITVTDGIHINFNDGGVYVIGDRWHVQACGSWHTPGNGINSYLTSLAVYPYDIAKSPKAGFFRAWCGDYRVIDYITNKGEFLDWRTPMHLLGDGIVQLKVELAEISANDIEYIFCVIKGWDE